MMPRRELGWGLVLAFVVTGCAGLTSKPIVSAPPPATPVATTPSAPPAGPATSVAGSVDTLPSPAAERVLASIPEPLTAAQMALAPKPDTMRSGRAVAPEAAYDTLRSSVPIPAATQPLGTSQPTVATETASAPASPPPAAAPASAPPASAAAPAAASGSAATTTGGTGPCWRLQVAAPTEKDKADLKLEAAQSLLVVSMTIVIEKGYFKVRTRDCLSREAADALKQRAIESGFEGSFLVDTNAAPPPAKPVQHAKVPASKRKT